MKRLVNSSEEFTLTKLEKKDIKPLQKVLRQWVRDSETKEILNKEIEEINSRLESGLKSTKYNYFVLRNAKEIAIGVNGLKKPQKRMQVFKTSPDINAIELVNVFLD